ncbi:MAG: hypothetical protein FJ304_17375 [Planctomycetes bacterium]|nr:hypothetical protein [Planctomycetota bacterium]
MSDTTIRWRAPTGAPDAPAASDPVATPAPPDPLPLTLVSDGVGPRPVTAAPVVFPGYEILGELGRGGMGVVYKARQRNLNRLVALKVILGGPLASTEDKARFHVEAEAAARLHHPNIVQVYDVGEYAGFSFMALELIEGQTLRQWQNGAPVDPKQAARLVSALARAIHHAHEQGIVHRDIKPANVLLAPVAAAHPELGAPASAALPTQPVERPVSRASTASRASAATSAGSAPLAFTPKITDFGLAKALENGHDLTITGVACGTPNYMAPEQVRGTALSPAVDVYGLGAVLYELLTGRPPFVGTDAPALMNLILKAEPPGVRKLAPGVPRDLAVIVAKCLEKDAPRRYPTARDAADDLDRFLAGKPITARPVGAPERALRWVKRNPIPAAFLLLTTIGCAVTGGLALALGRAESEQRAARDTAEVARAEADRQHLAALSASEQLQTALSDARAQKQAAEAQKQTAEQQKQVAEHQKAAAVAARARAEGNLRVASDVIRGSMRELTRHPRFGDDDFRDARLKMLDQVRAYRDTVADQAPGTAEWLEIRSDVSHFLGYLEYVNKNHDGAAVEYQRAADAAARWAELDATNVEPRTRQSYSLVNAGNALVNARRYRDAETRYRAACAVIDDVLAAPGEKRYYAQALETYGQLANLYRIEKRLADRERVARQRVALAREAVLGQWGEAERWQVLAGTYDELHDALRADNDWEKIDRALAGAAAARARARALAPHVPKYALDYGTALLARAAHQRARGNVVLIDRLQSRALAALDTAGPAGSDAQAVEIANAYTKYADSLRAERHHGEAEARYNKALDYLAPTLARSPKARDVWVGVVVGRAHVYNLTGRHREAAGEWAKLATEDPDPRRRPRHELFVLQSFLFARDWKAATAGAEVQMRKELPGWMWYEVARVWCLAANQIGGDGELDPADRLARAKAAIDRAVTCLEKARAGGEFNTPERVRFFQASREFDATRGKFDPAKK